MSRSKLEILRRKKKPTSSSRMHECWRLYIKSSKVYTGRKLAVDSFHQWLQKLLCRERLGHVDLHRWSNMCSTMCIGRSHGRTIRKYIWRGTPGVQRGTCPGGTSSTPTFVRDKYPNGGVIFTNVAIGDIGSYNSRGKK